MDCNNCEKRKVYAAFFDMHWLGEEDCPLKCQEKEENRNAVIPSHWSPVDKLYDAFDCSECDAMVSRTYAVCPKCGVKINYVRMFDNTMLTIKEFNKFLEEKV